jgi:hypothetical protein
MPSEFVVKTPSRRRLLTTAATAVVVAGTIAATGLISRAHETNELVHLAGISDSVLSGEPSRICHSPAEIRTAVFPGRAGNRRSMATDRRT